MPDRPAVGGVANEATQARPSPATIGAVVFDIGGVLLDWNPRYLYRKVFVEDEAAMERFLGEVCTPEWHGPHDRGESTAESCSGLARAHPEHAAEIWAWLTRGEEMVAGAFDETVAILTDLVRGGTPCYALSNMEAETFPLRLERFAFFGFFAGIVISGLEKVAKPDPAIFTLLLDRFGLDAGTTLFIDDIVENLEAASALGLATLQYRSPHSLRRSLRALDLLPGGSEDADGA